MKKLKDQFDRKLLYLRLSITELCNFRCKYCLPDGGTVGNKCFLNMNEIRRLVTAFAELGVQKVRLTGGEPSLRKDFIDIIETISAIDGIKEVALTTNGYRLSRQAHLIKNAGANALNISIDSLNADNFHKITDHNCLSKVLAGVEEAQAAGFEKIKINVVLLKGINDHEFSDFLDWIKNEAVEIRFIELMQTGDNLEYFKQRHLSPRIFLDDLLKKGWQLNENSQAAGPAVSLSHPDYKGKIGFIMPYEKSFCNSCNRLRISSRGCLYLCLFTEKNYSLRHLLQADEQKDTLKKQICDLIYLKKESHFLLQQKTGNTSNLAMIGG